jgi:hypothetical protein
MKLPAHRLTAALPAYGTVALETDRERQRRIEHPGFAGMNATFGDSVPFASATEWLAVGPHLEAPFPFLDGRFESPPPLKLTPTPFKLTAALFD